MNIKINATLNQNHVKTVEEISRLFKQHNDLTVTITTIDEINKDQFKISLSGLHPEIEEFYITTKDDFEFFDYLQLKLFFAYIDILRLKKEI